MKITKLIFKLLLLSLVFVSCSNDDIDSRLSLNILTNDILISGQGSGAGSGSVSYVSADYNVVENNIYSRINGEREFGIYLQSLAFSDTNAYIVVDNTNTITVVNKTSFKEEGKITTGLSGPKFMTVVGNKGYVTNYGDGSSFVAVVDLLTNMVTSTIDVASGPEQIIENNGKLYMTHTYSNAYVTVIDIASQQVSTIDVDDNPDELFFNQNNELVVLSQGGTLYDTTTWEVIGNTKGSIQVIDVNTKMITKRLDFTEDDKPDLLCEYDGELYYYLNGGVYKLSYTDTTLPTTPIIEVSLSGMTIAKGELYGVDAGAYTSLSNFYTYDLSDNTLQGEILEVALGATKIYFTE